MTEHADATTEDKKANWLSRHKIVTAAIIILLIGLIAGVASMSSQDGNNTASSVQPKPVANKPSGDGSIKSQMAGGTILGMSQEATYKSIKMKVTAVETKDAMSEFGQTDIADNGTKFLVVHLTVTNLLDSPIQYNPFFIVTPDYKMLTAEDTRTGAFMTDSILNKDLNPGVPVSGYTLFVVPTDMHHATFGGINLNDNKYLGVALDF